ncbi:glycosyl transferase [Nocardioides gansuensis]|uniref:Glycosyl transferase n=1 Tax=Nocardioides gansuensis TaxID=2138300 RepID=A0A2T8FA78_9ACTN|nr:glycosyltransferase family 9 protein [Nocardioides gansuensis]PVG82577.1 glycosyl transferase [Nocardioides gansuensis]
MTHSLVVRPDGMGDVLLAGPAVRAVAAGSDRLTLLAGPRGADVARLLPGVDQVLCWSPPWIDPTPAAVEREEVERIVDDLAGRGIDRALVLTSFHQSPLPTALLLRMAGVPWIGAISEDYPGSLLDLRVHPPGDVPEAERALELARAAGHDLPRGDDGRLRVDVEVPDPVEWRPGRRPRVVIHPGTSVTARAWPPGHHAELVAALAEQGADVVVTGAPSEATLCARVAGDEAVDLSGRTGVAGLAAVLASADVVVAGNTGPAHLAAAVGTPVVSLFAPTVPAERWAPYGVPHVLLGDQDAPCRATRATTCPVPGHPCLSSVTAQDVIRAIEKLTTSGGGTP